MSCKENDYYYEYMHREEMIKKELEDQRQSGERGEDCVYGSPEKHTKKELNEILNNCKL